MGNRSIRIWWLLAALSVLLGLALSLAAQVTLLSIAGKPGSAKVVQLEGHNYVEVEGLARVTNSAISFSGNQIVLTLPAGNATDSASAAPAAAGFSKEFVATGMEAMAQMREWHAALKNAIDRSSPLGEDWLTTYRVQSQQALRLASLAINTDADKNAFPFLSNEFNNMRQLSDKYLQIAKSRTYIAPGALDNDPIDQRIRTCGRSLASMVTANHFVDDGSCH